jgi:hypothetical protein
VTDVNTRAYDTDLLDTLSKRVPVGCGVMRIEAKYVRPQSG